MVAICQWNEMLSQRRHNIMIHHFTYDPDSEEPELILQAWSRIVERCLDTLVASDHRDTLKW
jgi:hypothetical protein